eukprot:11890030-Prorocentrum_lima.AAC.1
MGVRFSCLAELLTAELRFQQLSFMWINNLHEHQGDLHFACAAQALRRLRLNSACSQPWPCE